VPVTPATLSGPGAAPSARGESPRFRADRVPRWEQARPGAPPTTPDPEGTA